MTHRGRFQPRTFCGSMITTVKAKKSKLVAGRLMFSGWGRGCDLVGRVHPSFV